MNLMIRPQPSIVVVEKIRYTYYMKYFSKKVYLCYSAAISWRINNIPT